MRETRSSKGIISPSNLCWFFFDVEIWFTYIPSDEYIDLNIFIRVIRAPGGNSGLKTSPIDLKQFTSSPQHARSECMTFFGHFCFP